MTILEMAQSGCLPPYLHIEHISLLMYPESEGQRAAFLTILRSRVLRGVIETLSTEEFTAIAMADKAAMRPDEYRETRPAGTLPGLSISAVAISGSDILPGEEHKPFEEQKIQIVHRDSFKKWLEEENEWPLEKSIPLSRWWEGSDEVTMGSEQIDSLITADRITINALIEALDHDPLYSDNKRSYRFLQQVYPDASLPPLVLLGGGAYGLYIVIAWAIYYEPPLRLYIPGTQKAPRIDRNSIKKMTDYRRTIVYRETRGGRPYKFIDFEIKLLELRNFLLTNNLCLPTHFFPKDPANSRHFVNVEESEFRRLFQEEVEFSNLLPELQKDVIKSVEHRHNTPAQDAIKNSLRALDFLNDFLKENERTEEIQRKSCLSEECLKAIEYIERVYCPLRRELLDSSTDENIFRLGADKCLVKYNGTTAYYNTIVGMKYIICLLRSPGKEFHVQQLQVEINGDFIKDAVGQSGIISSREVHSKRHEENDENGEFNVSDQVLKSDPLIDTTARRSYMDNINEIDRMIQDAEDNNDFKSMEKLRNERDQILAEFKKVCSQAGIRKMNDDSEKARKAVSSAIRRALEKIAKEDESLAKHLQSSLSMGEYCRYDPENKIEWKF